MNSRFQRCRQSILPQADPDFTRVLETDRWCKSKIDPRERKTERKGETASSTETNLEKEDVFWVAGNR
jgi:hypothetical protein